MYRHRLDPAILYEETCVQEILFLGQMAVCRSCEADESPLAMGNPQLPGLVLQDHQVYSMIAR